MTMDSTWRKYIIYLLRLWLPSSLVRNIIFPPKRWFPNRNHNSPRQRWLQRHFSPVKPIKFPLSPNFLRRKLIIIQCWSKICLFNILLYRLRCLLRKCRRLKSKIKEHSFIMHLMIGWQFNFVRRTSTELNHQIVGRSWKITKLITNQSKENLCKRNSN